MDLSFSFFCKSALLGIGLAMDAFSVSLANGLNEAGMRLRRMCGIAGIFAFFQFAMPMIGWGLVSSVARHFSAFEKYIPWIALLLLGYIGAMMLYEGIKSDDGEGETGALGFGGLILQGIATSIDALSVGFTIAEHNLPEAIVACAVIGSLTFFICLAGIELGRRAGTRLSGRAGILGGSILILIGLEIFITSWF